MPRWLQAEPGLSRPQLDCMACNRDFKCCAFQPFVPNFLLGAYLSEGGDLSGMREWLQPLGLIPDLQYRQGYLSTPEDQRGEEFLCRFYRTETRSCGNWKYRPGECSTYFCKSDRFDIDKYSRKVFNVETAMAQMALGFLGFEAKKIDHQVSYLNGEEHHPLRVEFSYLMEIYRRSWVWANGVAAEQVHQWTGELQWV